MSHEIRTRWNAIVGMADLLSETPLNEDQREYVQIFRDAGSNLLSLINDVLDLSKIEAGHLDLDLVDFDLNDLVQRAAELVAVRAAEKNLGWPTRFSRCSDRAGRRPESIGGRSSSIYWGMPSSLQIRARSCCEWNAINSRRTGNLLFTVKDTGIGIPEDKLAVIFERFTQVDSSMTRPYSGTGLGLTISRRLVERMGGKLWVQSEFGKGSTFSFSAKFAVHLQPAPAVPSAQWEQLAALRTLIVDDNATNRLIIARNADRLGIPCSRGSRR